MKLDKAIKTRRSIRKFLDKPVEKEKILKIVEAGNMAPSYCNTQAWRFIVIEDKHIIDRLVSADAAVYLKRAPVCIVILYDKRSDNPEYKDYVQSASACIQNMLLMTHSLGLGSCWTCHLPRKKEVQRILKAPWHYEPIAVLPVGYYETKHKEVPRKKQPEELISYNRFEFNERVPNINYKLHLKRVCRKIYYHLPFRKVIRQKINDIFERRFDDEGVYKDE